VRERTITIPNADYYGVGECQESGTGKMGVFLTFVIDECEYTFIMTPGTAIVMSDKLAAASQSAGKTNKQG
jgi:hypothetical protein